MALMETDDNEIQVTYLEIDKYEALVNGLFRKCERWLLGELSGDRLVAMFDRVQLKSFMILETNGKPDDFDWETIPAEIRHRSETLNERFHNACRLMAAVEHTVGIVTNSQTDTAISRAYHFGGYLREMRYLPE